MEGKRPGRDRRERPALIRRLMMWLDILFLLALVAGVWAFYKRLHHPY